MHASGRLKSQRVPALASFGLAPRRGSFQLDALGSGRGAPQMAALGSSGVLGGCQRGFARRLSSSHCAFYFGLVSDLLFGPPHRGGLLRTDVVLYVGPLFHHDVGDGPQASECVRAQVIAPTPLGPYSPVKPKPLPFVAGRCSRYARRSGCTGKDAHKPNATGALCGVARANHSRAIVCLAWQWAHTYVPCGATLCRALPRYTEPRAWLRQPNQTRALSPGAPLTHYLFRRVSLHGR